MLSALGARARGFALASPWTNVYGLARTVLALGTLGTLLASDTSSLFRPAAGALEFPMCDGLAAAGLFCVLEPAWAKPVAIAILLVTASGWRPRFTALPHWWVAVSFQASATVPDGGDQVTAVLCLLLLPVALTDGRAWHWRAPASVPDVTASLVAWSALLVIRLQVAGIYLQASMAKLGREEWADGTAMYYWLSDPMFGSAGWAAPLLGPVLAHPVGVTLFTWGAVAIEFALVFGLVARGNGLPYLLAAGLFLHASIALLMGLGSFALAMSGALVLYLRPPDRAFEKVSLHLPLMSSAASRTPRENNHATEVP
ncbi:HTTM domain-containing protein [Nonomuraea sp. NN258]|uniref:sporulation-delaying protein SdpB family protein n=1 Tax=Nonomuraea antri TaxID=2730852 RepID=UPI0015694B4E|nr:sporulation-delaying protein SdpB family protein [Nonomuraea antri]NRQ31658.1 HTTM domain-containing protein [Nonomuraea antri]